MSVGKNGLHLRGKQWKEELALKSCTTCHAPTQSADKFKDKLHALEADENNFAWQSNFVPRFLTRNALTRENFLSIRYLIEEEAMPPPLHTFSDEDKKKILEFLE